jgi:hypothetical protein
MFELDHANGTRDMDEKLLRALRYGLISTKLALILAYAPPVLLEKFELHN